MAFFSPKQSTNSISVYISQNNLSKFFTRVSETFILTFFSLCMKKILFSLFLPQAPSLELVYYITTMRQRKNCFRSCYSDWQNCINKCWKHTSTLSFWDLKYLLSRLLWCFSEHWWWHTAVKLEKSAVIVSKANCFFMDWTGRTFWSE